MSKKIVTIDDRIEFLEQFIKMFNVNELGDICDYKFGDSPENMLATCRKLKVLGLKWGDALPHGHFNIRLGKSLPKNLFDPDTYYIEWSQGNIGCYQFKGVNSETWGEVQKEWQGFLDKLRSFNPIMNNFVNCYAVYDIANGKRLMKAYDKICAETQKKIDKTLEEYRKKRLRHRIEKMQEELAELEAKQNA